MRRIATHTTFLILCLLQIGCGIEFEPRSESSQPDGRAVSAQPDHDGDTISIASFNIQVFGQSKLGKPDVMEVLTDIVRRFDMVAIQELRSVNQDVIPRFLEMINADGRQYDSVVGPRVGRTVSTEQYVYIYDTTRIELIPGTVFTVEDPDDRLHRPPLVAGFRVRGPPVEEAFTFTLVNIHTDPDEVKWELDALADVFENAQRQISEDDIILLGDLNVDERGMGRLAQVPGIRWVVSGVPTNTRQSKTYDNIVFDGRATTEFTGRWGVMQLEEEYGLTREQAIAVSDHLPIWAEFSVLEDQGSRLAGRATESAVR